MKHIREPTGDIFVIRFRIAKGELRMEWLMIVGPITGLLGILGVIFNWSIIKPLNESINELRELISNACEQIGRIEEKRQSMDNRLARVEESAKSAHHRLNDLTQEVHRH